MLKVSRGVAAAVLLGSMVLPLTGCLGDSPASGPVPTGTVTPGISSPTATPSPTAPAKVYSLEQLRGMVGSVHAIHGPAASVLNDAQLHEVLKAQAPSAGMMFSAPAECKDLLTAGTFSIDPVPVAAAKIDEPAASSTTNTPTASSTFIAALSGEDSGLFSAGIDSLAKALDRCSPATLTAAGHTLTLRMSPVAPALHGQKHIGLVRSLSGEGLPVNLLELDAMDGKLLVTASKPIPSPQPTSADIRELTGLINAVIDNAGKTPPAPTAPSASPAAHDA